MIRRPESAAERLVDEAPSVIIADGAFAFPRAPVVAFVREPRSFSRIKERGRERIRAYLLMIDPTALAAAARILVVKLDEPRDIILATLFPR